MALAIGYTRLTLKKQLFPYERNTENLEISSQAAHLTFTCWHQESRVPDEKENCLRWDNPFR